MAERNRRKQMWSDKDFIEKLEKIKAQRVLNNKPPKSITQLTKEMLQCPSFPQLEKEMVQDLKDIKINIKIKLDNKNLFG